MDTKKNHFRHKIYLDAFDYEVNTYGMYTYKLIVKITYQQLNLEYLLNTQVQRILMRAIREINQSKIY